MFVLIKRALRFFDRWALPLAAIATLATLVFAAAERNPAELHPALGLPVALWSFLVSAFALVKIDLETPFTWKDLAEALFKVTLGIGAVKAYVKVVHGGVDRALARFKKGHEIVVGDGDLAIGAAVARQKAIVEQYRPRRTGWARFFTSRPQVVLILVGRSVPMPPEVAASDLLVIQEKEAGESGLVAANCRHATRIWALSGSDKLNIEICERAIRLAGRRPEILCHFEDAKLKRTVEKDDLVGQAESYRVKFFCGAEFAAREMLKSIPPDGEPVSAADARDVRVLLVGFGSHGQALVTLIAEFYFRSGRLPRISVIDNNWESHRREFEARYPAINDLVQFDGCVQENIESLGWKELGRMFGDPAKFTAAYIFTRDEFTNIAAAKALLRWRGQAGFRVGVLDPRGGKILRVWKDRSVVSVRAFDETIMSFPSDDLPRELHGHYLREELKKFDRNIGAWITSGAGSASGLTGMAEGLRRMLQVDDYLPADNAPFWAALDSFFDAMSSDAHAAGFDRPSASVRPWNVLDEYLREDNRRVAEHLDIKLRAIGFERIPAGPGGSGWAITEDEYERLAEMEHDRWMADRRLAGYDPPNELQRQAFERSGLGDKEKDRQRRHFVHPSLVPYGALAQEERIKDRNQIELIVAITSRRWALRRREGPETLLEPLQRSA